MDIEISITVRVRRGEAPNEWVIIQLATELDVALHFIMDDSN